MIHLMFFSESQCPLPARLSRDPCETTCGHKRVSESCASLHPRAVAPRPFQPGIRCHDASPSELNSVSLHISLVGVSSSCQSFRLLTTLKIVILGGFLSFISNHSDCKVFQEFMLLNSTQSLNNSLSTYRCSQCCSNTELYFYFCLLGMAFQIWMQQLRRLQTT